MQEGELTLFEQQYNMLMARFHIVIENLFTECLQYWGLLKDRHNLRFGSKQVERMFQLYNICSLFCWNQTAEYYEQPDMLLELSVEQ